MDQPTMLSRQLDDSSLGSEEVESIVQTVIAALDNPTSGSELTRAMEKCGWVDVLAKAAARSDRAVNRLVDALADTDGYDIGSSPYDSYWQTVYDRALLALYPMDVRARALPFVLQLLQTTQSVEGRKNAARVLEWIGPAARQATPLLQRLVNDPHAEVRAAATSALESIDGAP